MPSPIAPGIILLKEGTLLPESVQLEREQYTSGWTSVTKSDCRGLDEQLTKAGWTFFYMAGQITTNGFGFDKRRRLLMAVKRAIQSAQSQKCNCLEIDGVTTKSFLGVPYTSVSAHSRHIQDKGVFQGQG